MEFSHQSVMLKECMEYLNIRPDGVYVDGTAGGGGHSIEIAKRLTVGRLIAVDIDPEAVDAARQRLKDFECASVAEANYKDIGQVLDQFGLEKIDGMLLDLGVSSYQFDNAERGFSYKSDARLDMRMSGEGITAEDIVNDYSIEDLTRILRDNAQEKFAYRIAQAIVRHRQKERITTTLQLSEIINNSLPAPARRDANPSRKAFQAIRIEVNREFDNIRDGLDAGFSRMKRGGRLVVLTFHSIEDRIVKEKFREYAQGCICPSDFPVCVCGRVAQGKIITKKSVEPSQEEQEDNRRSRSARLRAVEKI